MSPYRQNLSKPTTPFDKLRRQNGCQYSVFDEDISLHFFIDERYFSCFKFTPSLLYCKLNYVIFDYQHTLDDSQNTQKNPPNVPVLDETFGSSQMLT